VTASYELLQQQLKQANETIATLMEQMSRMSSTSKWLTVLGLLLIKLYKMHLSHLLGNSDRNNPAADCSISLKSVTQVYYWMLQSCWNS